MMQTILAIIPARGGSKGLPRKNILPLGDKALIGWTIKAAQAAMCKPYCLVSTDDAEIADICGQLAAQPPFLRPAALATDTATSMDVVFHALEWYEKTQGLVEYVMLLQPTSPFRTAHDIDAALHHMINQNAPACVSVCACEHPPQWAYTLSQTGALQSLFTGTNIERRQDIAPAYRLNGAVYIAKSSWLKQHKTFVTSDTTAYVMPQNRSVDIDTNDDFLYAQFLLTLHV